MRKSVLAVLTLATCSFLAAQQPMTNDSVTKLVKAGLSDDIIVTTINASPGTYDTSTDGLISLKTAGASDKVIAAIVMKNAAPAAPAAPPAAVPNPSAAPPPPPAALAQNLAAPAPPPVPPPFHSVDGKTRIYVTDHPIFEANGIAMASVNRNGGAAGATSHVQAGDDPRTVEVEDGHSEGLSSKHYCLQQSRSCRLCARLSPQRG